MVLEQEEGTVVGLQLQHPLLYKAQEVQEAGEVQEVQEVGEDLRGGGAQNSYLYADDAMDVDSNVIVPPGDPHVVRGQSQVIEEKDYLLEEEFVPWKNMLCRTSIELLTGAACLPNVRACVHDTLAFVKAKPEADFLVLMDMHSDYDNGKLVHSVDKHGNAWTQDASEVLCHHLGPELWKQSLDMVGTKGMILLACGPTFTKPLHFEKIKSLVSSKCLQFIIGFTAHSVQPSVVMPFMLQVIIQIYIHCLTVEQALEWEIAHWSLLSHTPVVLICWNQDKCLISQRYIASTLSGNVWGLPPNVAIPYATLSLETS
ncbi:hypothetical protein F4604DRAFT_1684484 [Suillus subluteus]|nr:hypothetical protein F4604DRAFT_1684484 [Suillus subluteus]